MYTPRYAHEKLPTWNDFVAHPNYDAFWKRQAATPYMNRVTIPTLNVAGWWDQEDFYGPITIFEALEPHDANHMNYLVVGPWNHGGWAGPEGQKLGAIDFGSPTARYFREHVQAPFFAHFLKDQGTFNQPKALVFESGSNAWRSYDKWPSPTATGKKLYFGPNGTLSFDAPSATDSGFDAYVSDPAHPVQYRHRPIPSTFTAGSNWPTWLVEDQRIGDHRADVLTYETEPLAANVTLAGSITAHLFASTSGTDSDWIVKLIDVYPETYAAGPEARRLRAHGGQRCVPRAVSQELQRPDARDPEPRRRVHRRPAHAKLPVSQRHRIMVQIQSSWFPLIDRNPQKFVPNIFQATDADFQSARQRVFRSRQYPTSIELPVEASRVE